MAGASLLALIDDIATVLDDIALMSKVAARKTAGVLGDDLALNAEQVSGVRADRELPVVWAVAKGSFRNKLILVPAALVISALAPWAIVPLLMLGGLYLCFEGCEKLAHKFLHAEEAVQEKAALREASRNTDIDRVAWEKQKISGAIRTDFILSAEIIVIALGTVADVDWVTRIGVICAIALLMTVGVYGLVALIVKLDDAGDYLLRRKGEGVWHRLQRWFGGGLLSFAPWLMKALAVVGTLAMFTVGGSILVHGLAPVEAGIHHLTQWLAEGIALLAAILPVLLQALFGVLAGALVLLVVEGVKRMRK